MYKVMLSLTALFALVMPQIATAATTAVGSNQIKVTGVVPDRRVIVVGTKLQVEQIFSNTDKDVVPSVHIGWIGGPEVPFSNTLQTEYASLMKQIKSNKVVSITLVDTSNLPSEYPDFTELSHNEQFMVKPTAKSGDSTALNYEINFPS